MSVEEMLMRTSVARAFHHKRALYTELVEHRAGGGCPLELRRRAEAAARHLGQVNASVWNDFRSRGVAPGLPELRALERLRFALTALAEPDCSEDQLLSAPQLERLAERHGLGQA